MNQHRPLVFTVLCLLNSHEDMRLQGDSLVVGGVRHQLPSAEELVTGQVQGLARTHGFSNLQLENAGTMLHKEFAEGQPISAARVRELLNHASFRLDRTDRLSAWRCSFMNRWSQCAGELKSRSRVTIKYGTTEQDDARMLQDWPTELLTDARWAFLDAPLPESPALSIDEAWVDVTLLDMKPTGGAARTRMRDVVEPVGYTLSPTALLERLGKSSVIIGEPGAGKTTLMKWLARQVIVSPGGRFVLPLFVSLRSYALSTLPSTPIIRFALAQRGLSEGGQQRWDSELFRLAGVSRGNVLVLLDGWDEVPLEHRDRVKSEIDALSRSFIVVISSRHSGHPYELLGNRGEYFALLQLPEKAVNLLAYRWLRAANAPMNFIDEFRDCIEGDNDLRTLSRNPFVLSLLCAVSQHHTSVWQLPRSRSELFERAMIGFCKHQQAMVRDKANYLKERRKDVERLAYHLVSTPIPRLSFNKDDVLQAGLPGALLTKTLDPSRLVKYPVGQDSDVQFLHAMFHEFLAACWIGRPGHNSELDWTERLQYRLNDATWLGILRFSAGRNPKNDFWHSLAQVATHPDVAGLAYIALAGVVAEASRMSGECDGGTEFLGVDLREELWAHVLRGVQPRKFVRALVDLDPVDFENRLHQALRDATGARAAMLGRLRDELRTPTASHACVDVITDPHASENDRAVAATRAGAIVDSFGRQRLRAVAVDTFRAAADRNFAVRALGYAQDVDSAELLGRIAREATGQLRADSIKALGVIGHNETTQELVKMMRDERDAVVRRQLISALGHSTDPHAREALEQTLLKCTRSDPFLPEFLMALDQKTLVSSEEMVRSLLQVHPDLEVREAACWALTASGTRDARDALIRAARSDPEERVRTSALQCLRDAPVLDDDEWLLSLLADDSSASDDEREAALEVLCRSCTRAQFAANAAAQRARARAVVLRVLETPNDMLALVAAQHGYHTGPELAPRLRRLLEDENASVLVRAAACDSLAHLRDTDAMPALVKLLHGALDVGYDEAQVNENPVARMAQAAARALAEIDVKHLLRQPGTTAEETAIAYSLDNGAWLHRDTTTQPSWFGPLPDSWPPTEKILWANESNACIEEGTKSLPILVDTEKAKLWVGASELEPKPASFFWFAELVNGAGECLEYRQLRDNTVTAVRRYGRWLSLSGNAKNFCHHRRTELGRCLRESDVTPAIVNALLQAIKTKTNRCYFLHRQSESYVFTYYRSTGKLHD